jgi:hypothetical protein
VFGLVVPRCGSELLCSPGEVVVCVLFADHHLSPPGSLCSDGHGLFWECLDLDPSLPGQVPSRVEQTTAPIERSL